MVKHGLRMALAFSVLFLLWLGQSAMANGSLVLVNETGVEIHAVFIGENNSDEWGENLLNEDETLQDGDSIEVEFEFGADTNSWDIRVEDIDGVELEFHALPLLQAKKVVLRDDDTAEVLK